MKRRKARENNNKKGINRSKRSERAIRKIQTRSVDHERGRGAINFREGFVGHSSGDSRGGISESR